MSQLNTHSTRAYLVYLLERNSAAGHKLISVEPPPLHSKHTLGNRRSQLLQCLAADLAPLEVCRDALLAQQVRPQPARNDVVFALDGGQQRLVVEAHVRLLFVGVLEVTGLSVAQVGSERVGAQRGGLKLVPQLQQQLLAQVREALAHQSIYELRVYQYTTSCVNG